MRELKDVFLDTMSFKALVYSRYRRVCKWFINTCIYLASPLFLFTYVLYIFQVLKSNLLLYPAMILMLMLVVGVMKIKEKEDRRILLVGNGKTAKAFFSLRKGLITEYLTAHNIYSLPCVKYLSEKFQQDVVAGKRTFSLEDVVPSKILLIVISGLIGYCLKEDKVLINRNIFFLVVSCLALVTVLWALYRNVIKKDILSNINSKTIELGKLIEILDDIQLDLMKREGIVQATARVEITDWEN